MADNTTLDSGSGGDTIATDDISGVKYQRIKLIHGADGVNAGDVSTANPLPVGDAGGTLTVDAPVGTPVFVRLSDGSAAITTLPVSVSGVATAANQATEIASLASLDGKAPALGQALAAASVPVVLPAAQITTLTPPAAITGFATESTLDARTGSLTETAPATDTASSGLNGRLQRIAQRITSLIALLPTSLGGGGGLKVGGTGTAGSAAAECVTVQGVASMTPLQVGDNSASLTVDAPVATPVFVRLSDGSSAIATLPVSLASVPSHAVTNAGTFAVQAAGDIAHDSADSGAPVKQGFKATTALSGLTLVANADRTDGFAGIDGVQIIRQDCNLEDIVTATPVAITDGSSTSVISAQGSGVKFYLTEITIANSSSSNVTVDLRDGTAGSVKWTFPVPANGGVVKTFKVPLPFSANTAMAADPSAAASTITVSALGFKSKV